jgi:carbamoyltransferase
MTNCYTVKENWRRRIPACIHSVDFTGRPQFVNKNTSPEWHDLILSYYRITGIPLLLNTSFNGHGEPIIDSPDQAFFHLEKETIDFLIMGGKIFYKK